jgi:hypothetical protein
MTKPREGAYRGNGKHRIFLSFLVSEDMQAEVNEWATKNKCNVSEALRSLVDIGLEETMDKPRCVISHDAKTHTKRGTPRPD